MQAIMQWSNQKKSGEKKKRGTKKKYERKQIKKGTKPKIYNDFDTMHTKKGEENQEKIRMNFKKKKIKNYNTDFNSIFCYNLYHTSSHILT